MVCIRTLLLLIALSLNCQVLIESSGNADILDLVAAESSWHNYEPYTYQTYNRSFPLFLRTNTSTFDVNKSDKWWWCVRIYSGKTDEGGRKLGSVCANPHPSLKETRLWTYNEAGQGSNTFDRVVLPNNQNDDGVRIWTIDFSRNTQFLFLSCDGVQVSVYSLTKLASTIWSDALYLMGVYHTMGYTQQPDECEEGKEFRTDTMRCTNCSLGHYRDTTIGHICQKCPQNTYALEGWAHCNDCPEGGCKPGWTCTPTDPTICKLAYDKMEKFVEYPFDSNCRFTLNETYAKLSWNDIWFLDINHRALGYIYWDYENGFVQFKYEVNTFHEWKFHSEVALDKTNHGLSTQVVIDMTDGKSLKMSIDGMNYIRGVTCPGDSCINVKSVKYVSAHMVSAHMVYENWANCGVIKETCEDTSEYCEETVSQHYCRTKWAITGCKKFCSLCEKDFTPLSTSERINFNINGRKSFLRIKDRNLVTAYNTAYYYKYTCVGLVLAQDEENEELFDDIFGMLCWNIYNNKLRISYKNGLSDEKIVMLPSLTNNEYYIWDFEIIEGRYIAVSCQGIDIWSFPMSADILNNPVTQIELSYGEVAAQVQYIELDIETNTLNNIYLSGEESTITCHNKIQTNLWFIRDVSWMIDGIDSEESEFRVNQTTDVIEGLTTLTVLPTMGSWNIECKFVVSHGGSDRKANQLLDMDYVKDINLHVSGCSADDDCLIIDNCNISVSRLCDGRKDCKNGFDEDICQERNEDDFGESSHVMRGLIDFEEVCKNPQTSKIKQLCYNRDRYSNGLYKEHLSRSHHNFLPPCIPGMKSSGNCKVYDLKYKYGMKELWHIPEKQILCKNSFGHPHVFAISAGLCSDDPKVTSFRGSPLACANQQDFITVSRPKQGTTFNLYKSGSSYSSNFFQCSTGNCIPYSQVCDLVDDCGDYSDEVNCINHYNCDENQNKLIPLKNKCDGAIDCVGAGDECSPECVANGLNGNRIIPGNITRFFVWAMGFIGFLLNGFLIFEFVTQLRQVESFNGFFNKAFAGLIASGDAIIAFYLIAIVAVDKTLSENYCIERPRWISSSFCTYLGGISTFGGELSLFSMTILSLYRAHTLNSPFKLRELSKKNKWKVFYVAVAMGICLVLVSFIPNFQFEDYFTFGMFYKNSTVFPGIATKDAHMQAIKFYLDADKMEGASWSWTSLKELLKFEYSLGEGRKIGFYGYNDICYFNYLGDQTANTTLELFPIIVLLINFSCFVVNVACYIAIFRITNIKDEYGIKSTTLKHKDQLLQFKIACIVFFDSLIWITFILLCLLHSQNVVDLRQYAKPICLCIIPLSSVINPIIFNGNMFFAKPDQLKRRQMGLWVTVLVGFGMALGLELQ